MKLQWYYLSSDPVENLKLLKNNIAERSVDINGIGMYTLGKYRKNFQNEKKISQNIKNYLKAIF